MRKVGRLERIACPGKKFKGKFFPSKEKGVGRLKVRVRGLSRSAAHKCILILGSSRSISSLATKRGAGFQFSKKSFEIPRFITQTKLTEEDEDEQERIKDNNHVILLRTLT